MDRQQGNLFDSPYSETRNFVTGTQNDTRITYYICVAIKLLAIKLLAINLWFHNCFNSVFNHKSFPQPNSPPLLG